MRQSNVVDLGIPHLGDAEFLGRGGFGQVYRARQESLNRIVAVKVIRTQEATEADLAMFQRECAAVGSLDWCPEIVSVFSTGTTDGGDPYLVMEFAPGGSLRDRLREHGPLSEAEVRHIAHRMARALAAAHQAGLLHRDVKPANILLSRNGEALLADFGIAKALERSGNTSTAVMAGTVAYMAPELLHDESATASSDVFSLGATLLEALTGRTPFGMKGSKDTAASLMRRALQASEVDLEDLDVDPGFLSILERCLAILPHERFANGQELADALAVGSAAPVSEPTLIRSSPTTPVPPPPVPPPPAAATPTFPVEATVARRPFPVPPSPRTVVSATGPPTGPVTGPIAAGGGAGVPAALAAILLFLGVLMIGGIATATVLISRSGSDDSDAAAPAAASTSAVAAPTTAPPPTTVAPAVAKNRCWNGALVDRGTLCSTAYTVRAVYWAFDFSPKDYGCKQEGDDGARQSYADDHCVFPGAGGKIHVGIYRSVPRRDERLQDYGPCSVVNGAKQTMMCSVGSAGRVSIRYNSDEHLFYASSSTAKVGGLEFLLDRMRSLDEVRYGVPVG